MLYGCARDVSVEDHRGCEKVKLEAGSQVRTRIFGDIFHDAGYDIFTGFTVWKLCLCKGPIWACWLMMGLLFYFYNPMVAVYGDDLTILNESGRFFCLHNRRDTIFAGNESGVLRKRTRIENKSANDGKCRCPVWSNVWCNKDVPRVNFGSRFVWQGKDGFARDTTS